MDLDPRLVKRYNKLVKSHMTNSDFLKKIAC